MSSISKTVQTSTGSFYQRMMPSCTYLCHLRLAVTVLEHIGCRVLVGRHEHDFVRHLDKLWCGCGCLVARSKFTVSATTPCVELIVSREGQCVEATCAHFLYLFALKRFNDLGKLYLIMVSVTTLPSVVGLASATPTVKHSVLVKCH